MSELSPPSQIQGRPDPDAANFEQDKRGTFRALMEAFVSLFVAVLLFRTFAAEGYMISTGSMAPCLLGYHKRVVCPTCGITFPFGTAYDTDDDPDTNSILSGRSRAVCPNCGQPGIDVSDVPRNHGDQLLVNKQAYTFQSPKRWEIVVFRNPARPTEAYVKRVVGLPGERIQIVGGDIVIDGQIARKSLAQQMATRILVHNHQFRPLNDSDFQPHWEAISLEGPNSERTKTSSWVAGKSSFSFRGSEVRRPDKVPVAWVEYHHWLRAGGQHDTTVHLDRWPEDIDSGSVPKIGLRFEPRTHEFSMTGALPVDTARDLMELTDEIAFRNAVFDLYEGSHIVAVPDQYGYNPDEETGTPNPVRDLMFSGRVSLIGGSGEFVIEMTNGAMTFSVVFDAMRREAHLYQEPLAEGQSWNSKRSDLGPTSDPVASAPWTVAPGNNGVLLEVSLFDKQVIVAIDGKPLFSPWPFEMPTAVQPPRVPVRFGARGLDVNVSQLQLYRDVYYTDTRSRHAVNRPYELKADEFFVLGDNSPVSHDSRRWDNPVVSRSHLIGKPFLVHLPSKPGTLRIGSREMHLRLPDWQRIRFLN
jgi:signal peptidase I